MKINKPLCNEQRHLECDLAELIGSCREMNESIAEVHIRDAVLHGRDFSEMTFEQVIFENCRLTDCTFARGSFTDTVFKSCDFSNSDFSRAYLCRCEFQNVKGVGLNFSSSKLKDITITGCNFKYAGLDSVKMERVLLERSNFNEAFLTSSFIRPVAFDEVSFVGTSFYKTMLKDLDFTSCILSNITVSDDRSELRGAIVTLDQAAELARLLGVIIK